MNANVEGIMSKAGGDVGKVRIWKQSAGGVGGTASAARAASQAIADAPWRAGFGGNVTHVTAEEYARLKNLGATEERNLRLGRPPVEWNMVDCQECKGEFPAVRYGDEILPFQHSADANCGMYCLGGMPPRATDERTMNTAHRGVGCVWCSEMARPPTSVKREPCPVCGKGVELRQQSGVVPSLAAFQEFVLPMLHNGPCGELCAGGPSVHGSPALRRHTLACELCEAIASLEAAG